MKAIELLMRDIVPDDIDLEGVTYDKKGMNYITSELATKHPEKYRKIIKKISDLGRNAAYDQGETITLSDMYPTFDKGAVIAEMKNELAVMESTVPKGERKMERFKIYAKYSDMLDKLTLKSITGSTRHNLGNTVISGSRGNPSQLKAMVTTPAVYTDYKDDMIDMFVENSYGEGLRPAEYLASTFGTRKGVISTKEATADAGDLAKQMVQAATKIVVSQEDCGTSNGTSVDLNDHETLAGRVLQRKYGDVGSQSVVDKQVANALKRSKVEKVIARSPLTCEAKQGVCQKCSGLNMDGKFPKIGEAVGITAAQALGEPLTQGALNTKHGGGAFGGSRIPISGFKVINQIMQSPSTYPNKATVSEEAGIVEKIEEAPQGGNFIYVNGEKHYSLPGFELAVKKGDDVEAGDRLSEGILDVKDIIRLRGIGSGRKQYADYLGEVFDNSGVYANKRNLEFLARGALDHVRINGNDSVGGFLPEDLASYNALVPSYIPDEKARLEDPQKSVGKYLQSPALHYSIGTKITPKMAQSLADVKFDRIIISDDKPEFSPEMIRMRTSVQHEPDWMASLHSSYQASRLSNAANTGAETNVQENIHFAPRLAFGSGFGDKSDVTGKF